MLEDSHEEKFRSFNTYDEEFWTDDPECAGSVTPSELFPFRVIYLVLGQVSPFALWEAAEGSVAL